MLVTSQSKINLNGNSENHFMYFWWSIDHSLPHFISNVSLAAEQLIYKPSTFLIALSLSDHSQDKLDCIE